jgi:exocyst complex component 5
LEWALAELSLQSAHARFEASDAKSEPNIQVLSTLRSVDFICHLWQQYVNTALFPLASSSVTIRREMLVFNNQTMSRIEGSANSLMQRVTDGRPTS